MGISEVFLVQDIEGKGKGIVAARPVTPGELILQEAPLMTLRNTVSPEAVAAALAPLTRSEQLCFFSLANIWKGRQHPLVGLWLTNALPCGTADDPDGEEEGVEGIFPVASRFNTSCRPNVYPWWNPLVQKLSFRAVRDVDEGEELCIPSLELLAPHQTRQMIYRDHLNFECRCEACDVADYEWLERDRRRSEIVRIRREAHDYVDPSFALRKIRRAIELLKEEGILELYGNIFYMHGYRFCALAGDAESARAWAQKAWEVECITKGPESESACHWLALVDHPENSEHFGRSPRKYGLTFKLQDVPGKGKGLIATRTIAQGELILTEPPLLQQDRQSSNAIIVHALGQLSEAQQREYFSLANAHRGALPPPLGIFKTNALPCGDHDPGRGVHAESGAVFALGSRFNSSCTPNVNNCWDDGRGEITFWAARDIVAGEELLIAYGGLCEDKETRRARLRTAFGFDCACDAYSLEGDASKRSDDRRVELAQLYDEIGRCGSSPAAGVQKVNRVLKLLKEEGLFDVLAPPYYYDAFQFCASSDLKNAKAWAQKACDGYSAVRGPQSESAKRMRRYAKNPRAHPVYGLLRRQTLSGPD
ncbi:hypothetical protein BD413DRAFT_617143 [Trametes elegans]|nr:hypothetical protein BD413DRAFT_617143 [Trametes elegans]